VTFTRIAIIYNPAAGRPREREQVVDRLAELLVTAGRHVEVMPTRYPGHATELARKAVDRGFDLVVAHGGDGTMNEVLQALVGTDATLCFWPGGTANVLAAEIGFPAKPEHVFTRILAGNVQRVTVGKANQRYFMLMAGVGLDAAVAGSVDRHLKERLGKAAFAVAALQFLRRWELPSFQVRLDGEEVEGRFLVAGNGHSYGGGFRLTPMAQLTDPHLDICIFDSGTRVAYLGYAVAALAGRHPQLPGVIYRKVQRAEIISPGGRPVPVQLDGEVVGTLPLILEAVPEAVRLLV
jgi:diacylglycerol kinase (ATP)